jgi:hypothetical protein
MAVPMKLAKMTREVLVDAAVSSVSARAEESGDVDMQCLLFEAARYGGAGGVPTPRREGGACVVVRC